MSQLPSVALAVPVSEWSPETSDVTFNSGFLNQAGGAVDISRFERSNQMLPGTYSVDLYVNDALISREDVTFRDELDRGGAIACFDKTLLERAGVAVDKLDPQLVDDGDCIDLSQAVPDAFVSFDPGQLRLDLSVPQVSLARHARGYVSPELWDRGTTAATFGYDINARHSEYSHTDSTNSAWLGLNGGLNIAGWRLRTRGSASLTEGVGIEWQNTGTYVQRDITPLRSQLTLGDSFTTGELFPSTGFRGVNLTSDERMLPDSQVGYAPVVRGTAETNARVEVRQNGYTIYETTVAPGAFEIDDLYATGYGGDLEVSVIEADGRVRSFSVPYAAVPRLLRPGASRYSATIGEVRDAVSSSGTLPLFTEATYQRGLNNRLTVYTGVQATEGNLYQSALLGAALNTPVGALSADMTGSRTRLKDLDETWEGYSARATYSKAVPSTRTNFSLAAYRYSSPEFLELREAVMLDDASSTASHHRPRDRFQVNLSQGIGASAGTVFASGSYTGYRNDVSNYTTYQAGYSNRLGRLSYSLTASQAYDGHGEKDTQYFLNLSMPLDVPRSRNPVLLNTSISGGSSAGTTTRAGVTGTLGDAGRVSYAINTTNSENGESNLDASINWLAPYAQLGTAYTWSDSYRQASVNASGGVVVHAGGVTFAQRLGETIGVVEAEGAQGAWLGSNQGKVDRRGYAVVPDLVPYRLNRVWLTPDDMSMDVDLKTASLQVAPRAGAVVPLHFETTTGRAVLIRSIQESGEVLPFGAQVINEQGLEVGLVGQGGLVFARGGEDGGWLTVRWGNAPEQQCRIEYSLPPRSEGNAVNGVATADGVSCR